MIGKVNPTNVKTQYLATNKANMTTPFGSVGATYAPAPIMRLSNVNTQMTPQEQKMYLEILSAINTSAPNEISPIPQQFSQGQKLDVLLKSGKLLNRNSNDNTSTLENLHKILTTSRINDLSGKKLVNQTINALFDPTIITQKFGDIPREVKDLIKNDPKIGEDIQQNPSLMDVETSGTCVATSVEFHMANKHPAEFARWVEGLSSPNNSVEQKIDTASLSKNFLDVMWLLDAFNLKTTDFDFNKVNLTLKPDENAITRAMIQDNYQDPYERSIVDVLMQSTIMNVGSQGTYNSLSDIRKGEFNANPQGLIEFEKTFVESVIENKEKLSIVYQNVDENQTLLGYKCDFKKIEEHIKNTLAIGEDVIIGYVMTDKNNQIINGHEITIVGAREENGRTIFICNDTDDGQNSLIEYPADELIPKIHHAGYPAKVVEHETDLIYS